MAFESLLEKLQQWDPLVQFLIAIGTLAVAIIAYVEIRHSHGERRERERLELANRVYKPLRDELTADPWRKGLSLYPRGLDWSKIDKEAYPTSAFVPTGIREQAVAVEVLSSALSLESSDLHRDLAAFLDAEAQELKARAQHPGSKGIRFLLMFDHGEAGADLDVFTAWLGGGQPADWLERSAKEYGRKAASVRVFVNHNQIGGHDEAMHLLTCVKQRLDGQTSAQQFRARATDLASRREALLRIIEAEVRKLR